MRRGRWLVLATILSSLVVSSGAADDRSITALAPFEIFADGFRDPRGIAVGPSGDIYVAAAGNHAVEVYSPSGRFIRSFGTVGTAPGQFNVSVIVERPALA